VPDNNIKHKSKQHVPDVDASHNNKSYRPNYDYHIEMELDSNDLVCGVSDSKRSTP